MSYARFVVRMRRWHIILSWNVARIWPRWGYTHWTDPYPLDRFCDDAERGSVYAMFARDNVVATISIFKEPPSYLDTTMWSDEHVPALYVARLAVRPAYQGKSYGRFLMHFAEVAAHTWKRPWVRLAAVVTYPPIRSFL